MLWEGGAVPRLRCGDSLGKEGGLGRSSSSAVSPRPLRPETRTWQLPRQAPRASGAHEENWLHNRMPVECLPAGQATKILRARIFLPHFFCRVLSMPGAVLMNSIWGCVLSFLLCPLLTSPKAASFPASLFDSGHVRKLHVCDFWRHSHLKATGLQACM